MSNNDIISTNEEGSVHKRRRVSIRKESRSRHSIPRTEPIISPDSGQAEDLDPTLVTMAALCSDTGQGRVSSKAAQIQQNHITWKLSNKEKRAKLRSLLEAKKYGLKEPIDKEHNRDFSSQALDVPSLQKDNSLHTNVTAHVPSNVHGSKSDNNALPDFDYSQALSTNDYNVRVRIGPNGETVLDEETLYVDRAADPAFANETYTHIEESDQTKFVNSQTYSRKPRGSRWTNEETDLFYNVC